jgi:hypothetical protein
MINVGLYTLRWAEAVELLRFVYEPIDPSLPDTAVFIALAEL